MKAQDRAAIKILMGKRDKTHTAQEGWAGAKPAEPVPPDVGEVGSVGDAGAALTALGFAAGKVAESLGALADSSGPADWVRRRPPSV